MGAAVSLGLGYFVIAGTNFSGPTKSYYAVKKGFVKFFAKFFEVFAKFFKVFASFLRFSRAL